MSATTPFQDGPAPSIEAASPLARRYVGPPGRQVHLIEAGNGREAPVICLHATAYSARTFEPLMRSLGRTRRVMALDTPGYGASDPPTARPDLAGYATRIGEALYHLEDGAVHLLGYHTGALIAAELARQRPDFVRRVILIGVPVFSGEEQRAWRRRLVERTTLTDRLDQFTARWDFLVTDRAPGIELATAFHNFVDELRAHPNGWWAHEAAFSFDGEACLRSVTQPILVLNPATPLADASRRAAALAPLGRIVELPHLGRAVLEAGADEIASEIAKFLGAV